MFRVEGGKIVSLTAGAREAAAIQPVVGDAEGGFGEEVEVLARIPLFAGLSRARLKLLSFASERFSYDDGEEVFHQGDPGDKAFLIVEGAADVVLDTAEGPRTLVTLKRGALFGELALLCDAPRSASIIAAGSLSLMSISKELFLKLIAEDAEMSARVTRSVAEHLERTTRDLGIATAIRDSLTNLPDKRVFADRMRLTIARNRRFAETSGLLLFDTKKNFELNGALSRDERARLLRAIGERLRTCARDTDTAARVSDLDFAILVSPAQEELSHRLIAQRIANAMALPIDLGGSTVTCRDDVEFRYRPIENADAETQLAGLQSGEGKTFTLRGNSGSQTGR